LGGRGGGWDLAYKKGGTCCTFKGFKNVVLVPFRVDSLKRSTAGTFAVLPFRVLSLKNMTKDKCVVLELIPLRGEKHFKPRPQNRILVPLRGSF